MEMTPRYGEKYEHALVWAASRFEAIGRKPIAGPTAPYLLHLLSVSALVWEDGGNETQAIAALLHDAIEDLPGITHETICGRFGSDVANIVSFCTDTVTHKDKPPWRIRKHDHIARLRTDADAAVLRVVAADKLHNLESTVLGAGDPPNIDWNAFKGGYGGTRWYDEQMLDVVRGELRTESMLVRRLDEAVRRFAAFHAPDPERVERVEAAFRAANPAQRDDFDYLPDAREIDHQLSVGRARGAQPASREGHDAVRSLLALWYGDPAADTYTDTILDALSR